MSPSPIDNRQELPVKSSIAVAVSMALGGHAAQAQTSGGIEEITVTASKREESMQDVSASIQAITGDDLKRQGLANMVWLTIG